MFARFLTISTLALAATGLAQAQSTLTSAQVVQNIDKITDLSRDTNTNAMTISVTNLFSTTPKVINGFRDIIQLVSSDIEAMNASPSEGFVDEGQQQICATFHTFVVVHQQLLATVIGKHGLLSQTPFTQPMAQVLRTLEGGVDTLAFGLIDMVPTCADGAKTDADALGKTLEQAINTYSG